jgi:hypothetical protein
VHCHLGVSDVVTTLALYCGYLADHRHNVSYRGYFVHYLLKIAKSYVVRTIGNVLLGVLGELSLLPALAVVILIVDGSFRHVGV